MIDSILKQRRNMTLKSLLPLSSIKTREDIEKYKSEGYIIGYTCDEWRNVFPLIDVDKVFFLGSPALGTVYFDGIIYLNLPILGTEIMSSKSAQDVEKTVQKAVAKTESDLSNKRYTPVLLSALDGMRPGILRNILDKYGPSPELYDATMKFYTLGECDAKLYKMDFWKAIAEMKSAEQKDKTKERLDKDFPNSDTLTVYRGWADESTPMNEAVSWTPNINVAIFFAGKAGDSAKITIGSVNKKSVLEYFPEDAEDGRETEIIVPPQKVKVKNTVNMLSLDSPKLDKCISRVQKMYFSYREIVYWLYKAKRAESHDHEALHSARVLLYALLIAEMEKSTVGEKVQLSEAAVFHDIGRTNDGIEIEHGKMSRKIYEQYTSDDTVSLLIELHCATDEKAKNEIKERFSHKNKRNKILHLLSILKDADALDRVRFGICLRQGEDGLDVKQLRTQSAFLLVPFAMQAVWSIELDADERDDFYSDISRALRLLRDYFT